jgi:hypothetical protein
MLNWLKFHKELKLFALKALLGKTFLRFLEELNWESKISKYYFVFIQTYASLLAKEWITNVFYSVKIVFFLKN